MTNHLSILPFVLLTCIAFGQTERDVQRRLVGTWKLVSSELIMKDGSIRPDWTGPQGQGFLMYQADGYMCADLVNPDRQKWTDPLHPTPAEMAAAGEKTFAYCGHYEIDTAKKQIIHLPEVATDPGYVGSRQIRPYTFAGKRLILSDVEKDDSAAARWKIVWEKVRQAQLPTAQQKRLLIK